MFVTILNTAFLDALVGVMSMVFSFNPVSATVGVIVCSEVALLQFPSEGNSTIERFTSFEEFTGVMLSVLRERRSTENC